ncbi:TAT-variant-translocated molybdopterin oxidoreductase [Candidatus Viridilinea mediisalina]|uniref:Molybdopterin oxidoreductase n=1 Tax=Candidatus Viridilinea mediisalina TaxID=2024553 RepID=A0A2A6RM65_9CHLR|nr:TAT-variant-translocated molybdopterin oxidoreductase [Candidatus Viridilinea mediisalina]PDW03996.1 molybdopterin oxidoreductase [Candidatus Viridilinea mediisalina]
MTSHTPNPDLETVREQLRNTHGKDYWRSLDQLADTPAFRELLEREFPRGAAELGDNPVSRRTFLKLMGASLALAGVTGCTFMPPEQIAPFDRQPMNRIPGIPNYFATAVTLGGYATGVIVRSNDGRPTKIEGNPVHPASWGATDIFAQGDILTMYDPDRSQQILQQGEVRSWDEFVAAVTPLLTGTGAGLRILTPTITSPTLAQQLADLQVRFPQCRWYQYEPLNRDNVYEGSRLAFGEDVATRYDFSKADVVVALDADFLAPGPGFIAYARAFADARKVTKESEKMNRLYVVEATPSTTGATADHRLPLQAGHIAAFAKSLAAGLGVGSPASGLSPQASDFLTKLLADLQAHRGSSLVIAGDQQPPVVHALAHAINEALGNVGETVIYTEPVVARPANHISDLANLIRELNSESVDLLVILGGNPAFDAPGDLRLADALRRAGMVVHHGLFVDETAQLATWHVPAAHSLESWSDARAFDGTASIIQPLIEPLYRGKTAHELLAVLLGLPDARPRDLVRAYWQEQSGAADFERFWHEALASGIIPDTAAAPVTPTLNSGAVTAADVPTPGSDDIELVFRPDAGLYDGTYANNGWLMELPRPISQLVWDNAALMSPSTADRLFNLGLGFANGGNPLAHPDPKQREINLERITAANGTVVSIAYEGSGRIELPIWLTPGHADNSITVMLGYGRSAAGRVGNGVGVNAYPIRLSNALWFVTGLSRGNLRNLNRRYQLVSTQNHWTMEGRDLYRVGVFDRFKTEGPEYIKKEVYQREYGKDVAGPGTDGYLSLQTNQDSIYEGRNAWAMTINLNACIGCNACIAACQAENNIPVVGKDQVAVGREMQWLRIDRYYAGANLDNPSTYFKPVGCVQCERAPCEVVCPVAATVHDYEGLNNMVYNRCVGTKYCSNNCPFKVRRFNFFQYTDLSTESLQLQRNPEVTVRNRGVMEKCSYCIQRISAARIAAKKAAVQAGRVDYVINDGDIVTACEAVCPTQAIVFGDKNDEQSRVAKWKKEKHNYYLLGLLNVTPRTTYLARVRNPNSEFPEAES